MKLSRSLQRLVLALSILGVASSGAWAGRVVIVRDPAVPQVEFAAREIAAALEKTGDTVDLQAAPGAGAADASRIVLAVTAGGAPQGFAITKEGETAWRVSGGDPVGAMYGGLQLAESIRFGKGLARAVPSTGGPAIAARGIKFNIPLDARTPSYDDTGDAAQNNIAEMWNFDFWREFLDDMARDRYNVLSLWNPHPFPSMLKLAKYPGVALDDVCATTLTPSYKGGSWNEPQGVSAEVLQNLKVLKKMSIDEKIAFWQRVMKYARDRGIDVYFITWNVLVNSAEGKHGIDGRQDNPATIAYLRECTREMVQTYPDLTGIGVTAGERMKDRKDEFAKEKWLWSTYGQGVVDAKKEDPQRKVRFIHRVWQTSVKDVMQDFGSKYPDPFDIEFKYAHARLYASPTPPFADELLKEMAPYTLRCWWNLRNDDIFCFRWGDPYYVSEFVKHFPLARTAGYLMGSDGYVWGREFTSRDPDSPRQLEIRKHWYSFMLWGRLGYDPTLERPFFEKALADHFPEAPAIQLYDAWLQASRIVPQVNRFHWKDWDFQWSVEGCLDQHQGFHTVDDFIRTKPMPGSRMISVQDFVKATLAGQNAMDAITPPVVARNLNGSAGEALTSVKYIRGKCKPGKELEQTLGDLEAMAHLGDYYSEKILGAVELESFRTSKDPKRQAAAVKHLEAAARHWKEYADVAGRQYKPQLLARTRVLDWAQLLEDVRRDIEIARKGE